MQDKSLETLNKLQREIYSKREIRAKKIMAELGELKEQILKDLAVDTNTSDETIKIYHRDHMPSQISEQDFFRTKK
ncbi:hypothetical protein [Vibrio caribbeanicus]|uniref:Uncharacterized protein n=1 Tax=Vibrio caribbeanicus ATCC BAA-2122 TaxID=796620 RepID=E3BKF0_9VIBR|nr:hypothetical protein [Vibrio caribbeanicus]EFP96535.1 hypothetical protein VIBC2010_05144 [Vibrio caribbeanicus ATCC BAA-2122]